MSPSQPLDRPFSSLPGTVFLLPEELPEFWLQGGLLATGLLTFSLPRNAVLSSSFATVSSQAGALGVGSYVPLAFASRAFWRGQRLASPLCPLSLLLVSSLLVLRLSARAAAGPRVFSGSGAAGVPLGHRWGLLAGHSSRPPPGRKGRPGLQDTAAPSPCYSSVREGQQHGHRDASAPAGRTAGRLT